MYPSARCLTYCAVLSLCAASLFSQTAPSDSQPTIFRAETRLVLLDIVVTNGKGEPVSKCFGI